MNICIQDQSKLELEYEYEYAYEYPMIHYVIRLQYQVLRVRRTIPGTRDSTWYLVPVPVLVYCSTSTWNLEHSWNEAYRHNGTVQGTIDDV